LVDSVFAYDLIGYLASSLIVLSLLMTSVLRLRLIGFVGAVVFAVYGLLIAAIPVVVTNGVIVLVHGFHLTKLLRARATSAYFEVIRWPTEGVYLPRFVAYHADDIARSQPRFTGMRDDHLAWVILRNAQPVGLVLARHDGSGTAQIDLDYVTPAHRDFAAGLNLFSSSRVFTDHGINEVVARADTEAHRCYLREMGFEPLPSSEQWTRQVGAEA
jgi:hypothetical protein